MTVRVRRSYDPGRKSLLGVYTDSNSPLYATLSQHNSECIDEVHAGPPYKSGGPLNIRRLEFKVHPSEVYTPNKPLLAGGTYSGALVPSYPEAHLGWSQTTFDLSEPAFSSGASGAWVAANQANLNAVGVSGWARSRPGNPVADLGQFLAELRDIPTIPAKGFIESLRGAGKATEKAAKFFKELGSEYLNGSFGWAPFLKDLGDLIDFQENLGKRLAQLSRDNGKPVRRQATLLNLQDSTSSTTTVNYPFWPTFHPFLHDTGSGRILRVESWYRRDWFKARFRYYIPDLDTDTGRARTVRALLGLNPTPSLLYEVMPWSWFIDWFVNAGDALHNISSNAAEDLVAEYAYAMSTASYEVRVQESGRMYMPDGSKKTFTCSTTWKRETKGREAASPFGFGVTSSDLSGRQKLILGALGISRSF